MSDIFISYSRNDSELAEKLVKILRSENLSVFIALELPAGVDWRDKLQKELEDAKVVIVLWSASSLKSSAVHDEANHAKEQKKLLPVQLESGGKQPIGFGNIQAADLSGWDGSRKHFKLEKFLGSLKRYFDESISQPEIQPPFIFGLKETIKEVIFKLNKIIFLIALAITLITSLVIYFYSNSGESMCKRLEGNYRLYGSYTFIDDVEKGLRGITREASWEAAGCESDENNGFILNGKDASRHDVYVRIDNNYELIAKLYVKLRSQIFINKNGMLYRRTLSSDYLDEKWVKEESLLNGRLAEHRIDIDNKIEEYEKLRKKRHTDLIANSCSPAVGVKDSAHRVINFCPPSIIDNNPDPTKPAYTRILDYCRDCPPIKMK
jgi:hypothetical protein